MNPSRKPSWRVVTQRLASAIVALARPPPGGMTWSSRSFSSLRHQRRERAGVGAHPARPVDHARPLDDARQRAAERRRQGRHDPGHRLGVGRLGGPQLGRRRGVPGASRSRPMAIRSTSGQSISPPLRADCSARRPATVAAAPSADPIRNPACQTRSSRHGRPAVRSVAAIAHRAATARSTCSTSGKADPNSRLARAWNAAGSPVVSWRWPAATAAGAAGVARCAAVGAVRAAALPHSDRSRGLEAVDAQQLGQRGRRGRRRIDDRDRGRRRSPR